MNTYSPVVIIPCGENRLENLNLVLESLYNQTLKVMYIVIVCDGFMPHKVNEVCGEIRGKLLLDGVVSIATYNAKHVGGSGTIQPKNAGAIWADDNLPIDSFSHYWFVDSDIIMDPEANQMYAYATQYDYGEPRIMIGPYEWLPKGKRELSPEIKNDPRWDMFNSNGHRTTAEGNISYAMANFGGNIVYPAKAFRDLGGFWDELSAGRVEDGEIGLRFCAAGVPMTTVGRARGYHLDHPVNHQWKLDTNTVEVPMLDERHPWVHNHGIYVSDNDGKRFEWVDPETGEHKNTLEMWKSNE